MRLARLKAWFTLKIKKTEMSSVSVAKIHENDGLNDNRKKGVSHS